MLHHDIDLASGGVIVIKFIHAGQTDSISAVPFDKFREDYRGGAVTKSALPFATTAEHFAVLQQEKHKVN